MAEEKKTDEIVRELVERVERLENENQRLKQQLSTSADTVPQENKLSRRSFLKKLGAGAIGLGVLSLSPAASKLTISDNGITQDGEDLYLGLGGSNSMTGDLNMGTYSITNTGSISTSEIIDGAGVSHTGELADEGSIQPPENHDNSAHSVTFISDGDGTERQIWVIANGASDPSGADPEDIIFEEGS